MKAIVTIFGMMILFGFVPTISFGDSDDSLQFFSKGVITGEHFNGGITWIGIDGDRATIIGQWELGRVHNTANVINYIECVAEYDLCLELEVDDVKNNAAAEGGDLFILKIDVDNENAVIEIKEGFLKDVSVFLDLTKIYKSNF